ncbi:hypothetical protein D3C77_712970 [compost metagenome]
MMLEVVSAGVSPSATRTTMVKVLTVSAISCRLRARVPVVPALATAACTSVSSTGVLSGKAVSSASSATQTMPITAVAMVVMVRVPSLISTTRTP